MPPHFSRHPHLARIIIHLFIKSDIAVLAAKQGLLNVSAFARLIQSQVEKTASKKVGVKTISMTILRYIKNNELEFSLPKISLLKVQEKSLRYGYSKIEIKFDDHHPNQFYIILSRLAIYEIRIVSLSINNGIMSMSVDQDQSGLVLIALRELVKREQVFS